MHCDLIVLWERWVWNQIAGFQESEVLVPCR